MTRIAPQTRRRARELRKEMTPQERRLWTRLREMNRMLGTHFRRQAPVGPYIADFAEFGRRLMIETDGGGHGGARDTVRDAWFAGEGFTVLRFWNAEVDGNIVGVMQVVLDALEGVPPTPIPSPQGGGEPRFGGRSFETERAGTMTCRETPVPLPGKCAAADPVASPPPCGEGMGVGEHAGKGPKGTA